MYITLFIIVKFKSVNISIGNLNSDTGSWLHAYWNMTKSVHERCAMCVSRER